MSDFVNQLILGDNLEVMRNMTGAEQGKFKPGEHCVAIKAIDNEGLEAIEVIKLKVNGVVRVEE